MVQWPLLVVLEHRPGVWRRHGSLHLATGEESSAPALISVYVCVLLLSQSLTSATHNVNNETVQAGRGGAATVLWRHTASATQTQLCRRVRMHSVKTSTTVLVHSKSVLYTHAQLGSRRLLLFCSLRSRGGWAVHCELHKEDDHGVDDVEGEGAKEHVEERQVALPDALAGCERTVLHTV